MKKYLLLIMLVAFSFKLSAAYEGLHYFSAENGICKPAWTPFQLALVPAGIGQLVTSKTPVYGIGIGAFVLDQEASTLSLGLTSCLGKNYGLQCSVVTMTALNYGLNIGPFICFIERNYGVQISLLNVEAEGKDRPEDQKAGAPGVQIGGFNIGQGYQIGLMNYNTNAYIPVLPIFNFSK